MAATTARKGQAALLGRLLLHRDGRVLITEPSLCVMRERSPRGELKELDFEISVGTERIVLEMTESGEISSSERIPNFLLVFFFFFFYNCLPFSRATNEQTPRGITCFGTTFSLQSFV